MPSTASLTNASATKYILIYVVASALLATATDSKHLLPLFADPHILAPTSAYGSAGRQLWRIGAWATAYTNSAEVLFAALAVWQLRIIERIWGTRKFLTFILTTLPYTVFLPPLFLVAVLRPLSAGYINYLPSGPTSVIFALLAQYHAAIPYTFRYKVSSGLNTTSSSPQISTSSAGAGANANANAEAEADADADAITLTSKSISYLPALQLALSQLPGSAVPALVGWCVGLAWRAEILPMSTAMRAWRIPAWLVGEKRVSAHSSR